MPKCDSLDPEDLHQSPKNHFWIASNHAGAILRGEAMCVCGTSQVACSLPVDVGNELRVRRRCHRHTLLLRVGVGCCACRPRALVCVTK